MRRRYSPRALLTAAAIALAGMSPDATGRLRPTWLTWIGSILALAAVLLPPVLVPHVPTEWLQWIGGDRWPGCGPCSL